MKKKPTIKPVILGVRNNKPKKDLMPLHYHPDAIRENVKDLITMAEGKELTDLFEDIALLVNYALDRVTLTPPKEKGEEQTSPGI